ncbi:MAG: hypothetical protein ABS938_18260, partial [Psychrobacillus psychrodurans]
MNIDKDYIMELIDTVYSFEKAFTKMTDTYEKNMEKVSSISIEIETLLKELPNHNKLLKLQGDIKKLAKDLLIFKEYIQQIQSGKTSLFNWQFLSDNKLNDLKKEIDSKNLISWLSSKLDVNQQVIYSEIVMKSTPFKSEYKSRYNDFMEKFSVKERQLLGDKEKVYIFLISPYDILGKEI